MATNLHLIREVRVTNGTEIRTMQIFSADEGFFATDSSDRFLDGLTQLADDSDAAIADMLRESDFAICDGDEGIGEFDCKTEYTYRTDSERGAIEAVDFDDACRQLDAMFTPELIADGAWGWVEDADGYRYYVARENMP